MGLHDPKQLAALFGSVGTTPNAPPQQTPVEPATAPIPPSAPAVPPVEPVPQAPAPPTEPVRTEPNILELLPEKFRDKDAATSIQKITKSYSDIEAELQKQKDELAQMNKLVQSLSQPSSTPQIPAAPTAPGIGDDVDDTQVWEKPKESVIKLASKVAAAQILAYHELQERVKYVEAFKQSHPDFDSYKEDMMVILRSRPDLDRDYHNLPAVYEASKARYSQRLSEMKSKMGLETPAPPPPINVEEIERRAYEKARKAIEDEFAKRQAASGIMGSGTPVSPDARVTPAPPAKPKSVADQVIEDMLASGPKKFLSEL